MAGLGRFRGRVPDRRQDAARSRASIRGPRRCLSVWKVAQTIEDPRRMAIFGSSAGGGLTLSDRARQRARAGAPRARSRPARRWRMRPRPATLFTPMSSSTMCWCRATACVTPPRSSYANGHDLGDPLLSPVYGDFSGFPPTILTSGTRDLLLSNTVRVHRKLRQAGVEAALHVYEGQSHAHASAQRRRA